MAHLEIFLVDAFTSAAFRGNPAAVVTGARGLSATTMQVIAREINVSETAFVIGGKDDRENVTLRFFTPTSEVPICGHATIAAHYVLAEKGASLGVRYQNTAAGRLRVESEMADGALRIWMHQRSAEFEDPLAGSVRSAILAAIGLGDEDLMPGRPIQIVSTGHSKILIPVRTRNAISRLTPDNRRLAELSAMLGCNGYYPFTLDNPDPGAKTHGRMFAPAIGIAEDPVTGNASGCLGAYLVHHDLLDIDASGRATFVAGQGYEIGRPGQVLVQAHRPSASAKIDIRVAGRAVIVIAGEIRLS